jgi:hypothetical protein
VSRASTAVARSSCRLELRDTLFQKVDAIVELLEKKPVSLVGLGNHLEKL